MKRPIVIAIVVVIVGLIAYRLIVNKQEIDANKQVKDTSDVRVAVNTGKVENRKSSREFTMLGTLVPEQAIELKAETQGRITNLYIKRGDELKKGQLIARIDDRLLNISVSNAEQQLADARQNFERYKNLYEGGAASQAQFDQYKLALENAENALSQAKEQQSNADVRAPFDGIITEKNVEEGAFVNIGQSIATIVDVSTLKVELNVGEYDAYALSVGDSVQITSSVYPGVTYTGKVTFISPQGDATHNYPVEIAFKNQDEYRLKSGTYVNVTFVRKGESETLQLPREALVGSVKNARVYVLGPDSVVHLQEITVGSDNGEYLTVLDGVNSGDEVVTSGQINLADSTAVEVIQ